MPLRATLRAGYAEVAIRIQEAMDDLTSGDVRQRLSDAVRDAHKSSDKWAYYIDHTGDDESGDCYYSCDGQQYCAPYEVSKSGDTAARATVHVDQKMPVRARVVYEPEAEDEDHYAQMEESFKTAKLYLSLPLYERFISKSERDSADSEDFAGKGKSYPILKPEDVSAAAHALGRAGSDNSSPSSIKSKIIAIAKRKGWTKYLPKAWQGSDAKESANRNTKADLRLVESAVFGQTISLKESRATYPIKIISPGTGSSAHYPKAVLKKAAESGVFKAKTLMYWNHATPAEEAQRPEGDLDRLAAITVTPGRWEENGPHGPGVYAEAKVMGDYATKVEERAPHIGVSIRAGGKGSGRLVEGKPELASIDYVESIDYVTKAGRGGMALAEAASATENLDLNEGALSEMDAKEITKLQESLAAQTAINSRLMARALRGDAIELGNAILATTGLNEAQRKYVVESVVGTVDSPKELAVKEGGVLDAVKLTESINSAAKAYAATLPAAGRVTGMGAPGIHVVEKPEEIAAREAQAKRNHEQSVDVFTDLMGDKKLAESAVKYRVA